MSNNYDPDQRRKLVDMHTLSDINLSTDIARVDRYGDSSEVQQPFDPDGLDDQVENQQPGETRSKKSNRVNK